MFIKQNLFQTVRLKGSRWLFLGIDNYILVLVKQGWKFGDIKPNEYTGPCGGNPLIN